MDQFDRLIDEAARGMVQREPSDALTRAVMDQVTTTRSMRGRRGRLIWGSLAAAVVLVACVVALIPLNNPKENVPKVALRAPSPIEVRREPAPSDSRPASIAQTRRLPAVIPRKVVAAEDAGAEGFESLVPAPLETPPLETTSIPLERIQIAPLVIEPLSASND
jgi:hypothetical protein